ncbi:MAG: AAA family ATPase, partial [Streptococcus salivarius]|nr:AAA family ATPase [Streptococcus salivarius]
MKERTNHNLSKTPYIDKYTTDLTEKIRPKRQDFVAWGRQDEIRQVFISLNRLEKNSPVLIGEAGVGKTAIVEGICADILNKKAHVPTRFQGKQVKQLELSAIQGKEFDHTGKEVNIIAKMDGLIKEFMAHKDEFILFIDEVHTIMGTGVEGSALDVANSLKPALSRGEIYLISATTADEFMIIERDPAMERRLQPVYVDELDKEASILVLKKRRPKYKRELDIEIPTDAIKAAVELSIRYVTDKMLPDKAIDIIDEASSTANIDGKSEITLKDIASVIHRKKGIPMESLLRTSSTPVDFAEGMRAVVKGQDHVIRTIARLMYKGIQGGQNKRRPLGTLLLLGTTGTGKTELAKQAAKQLFGSEEAMIRLDMSEYMTDNAVVRLIGNDERKGDLTEKIKKSPYSLVLLDELE